MPSAMRIRSSRVGLRSPRSTRLNMDSDTPEVCDPVRVNRGAAAPARGMLRLQEAHGYARSAQT